VHEKLWLKMYPDHNFGGIFDVRAIEQTFDIHDTRSRLAQEEIAWNSIILQRRLLKPINITRSWETPC
jgi:hypothetical protein